MLQVLHWLVDGHSESDIIQAVHEQLPGEDPEALLQAAVDQLKKDAEVDRDVVYGWLLRARQELYRQMKGIGDFAGALNATKAIESLADKLG